ncbi:IS630 transposase-related protein [Chroococcus sp. FPU101]|uniref:helix-turn-helix domain-containing protein n=1 Tax=Chroococcus sp. FPU101 TaxID=1974212 RepID=UPI001A8E6942|nr:IS630 transposase-related protein [Chroococcus sp. FPU101]GFE71915.1 transposase [Chroococcus sp. FPU101]
MKAYSLDLRSKIIETYKNGEGSVRQVAHRYKVARSFVQKLIKQDKEKGNVAPLPHGGGTVSKLEAQVELIEKLLEEKNDATLAELCEKLKEETGIKCSIASMCRFCQKHNLTRKKNFLRSRIRKRKNTRTTSIILANDTGS